MIRLILDEDPSQARKARRLVADATAVLILPTVLLEAVWVLENRYGQPRQRVCETLASVLGLPNVRVQASAQVERALAWAAGGMDFADALHLAGAEDCDVFFSFDRDLRRAAAAAGASPAVQSP
ncbi:MAG: type II toxin-antitoxin system VapC family toxin [Caulobacteraceae bacterium]|nr:type II toxin-antitoxin system VapC family toxin [Caulobacter sp.]